VSEEGTLVRRQEILSACGFGMHRECLHRAVNRRIKQSPRIRLRRSAGGAPWGERRRRYGGVNPV